MERQFDIVGVGMCNMDIVMMCDVHPGDDEKVRAQDAMPQGGGPVATALVAAAKLGVSCAYMGLLAGDVYGRFLMDEFAQYGVDTSRVRRRDGLSSHSVVLAKTATGHRTVVSYESEEEHAGPGDIDENMLRKAKILHLDAHEMDAALYAAQKAKDYGVLVSLDAGSLYPGWEQLLPLVDILAPSEKFVRQWGQGNDVETAAQKLFEAYRPRLFAVTQGAKGGLVARNGQLVRYPAFAVKAVDSNGAGDVFHGGLVAALARGLADEKAVQFASAVAAIKCTRMGARRGAPGWDETMAFICENKDE